MKIVILGGGESGVGSAILAKKKGFYVFLSDGKTLVSIVKSWFAIIFRLKKTDIRRLWFYQPWDYKSPGIPNNVPLIQKAVKLDIPVLSEIEFAGRYTKAKMICITGSNGKTTTTSLLYYT